MAETLRKKLKDNVYYIDADTRTTESGYRKLNIMSKFEKFSEKVLISTSLLDNGINFHDPALKNIVVDSVDPIQVKQMIGRKRLADGESVNVYIVKQTQKEIQSHLKDARAKADLLDYYEQNPQRFIQERFPNLTEAEHGLF